MQREVIPNLAIPKKILLKLILECAHSPEDNGISRADYQLEDDNKGK